MDELESRLSDGLSRHAAGLPVYEGDLRTVTRRGRNRRWVTRGAGAVGALAILGGGVALYQAAGDRPESLATDDPGEIIVPAATPTATPTPEPTPELTPEPTPDPTPEAATTPAPEDIRDVFAVAANGWGVGLVGAGGEFFTALACCDGEDEDWRAQPADGPALGALRARDDLQGGLVASTVDTLWWQPATALASGAPIVLDTRWDEPTTIDLWDVQLVDETVRVLYSTTTSEDDGTGRAELVVADLDDDGTTRKTVLETSVWPSDDQVGYRWAGAAWVATGGIMELRSAVEIGCEWVVYTETDPAFESPFATPTADGECPQDSVGGASINADGQLAVIELYLSQPPLTAEVAVYDRVGNELHRYPLPETVENQPRWTEIDMVGSAVLVSRGAVEDPAADEVLRIDIGSSGGPRALAFFGNPSFARSNIATADLPAVGPNDDRWFGTTGGGEPDPTPDTDDEVDASPDATPTAGPSPTPEPAVTPADIPPESRIATGRGVDTKDAGLLDGDDGCLGRICVGMAIDEALDLAQGVYGDEDGDTAEALREGEPPLPNEFVFITDTTQVWITEAQDRVASVRAWPGATPGGQDLLLSPDGAPLSIGDILAKHGAPAEVFNGAGEGIQVVWLFYETTAALVAYGFTTDDPGDSPLLDPGDTSLPSEYDGLVVNSYWAQPID